RNHVAKSLAWKPGEPGYAGTAWTVKNLFELKNARRVRVEGNLFENNWVQAQIGFAIVLTVRNQDGRAPWSVVEDVTFANNVVRASTSGVNIHGRDSSGLISGLRAADGLIAIPEDVAEVKPGDTVAFIPFAEFGIVGR